MTRYKCPNCGTSNSYGGDPYPCSRCGHDGRVSLRDQIDPHLLAALDAACDDLGLRRLPEFAEVTL